MTDTTAKIRAKGCETTGLTEDLARKLWDAKAGKRLMAVVELEVVTPHGPDKEGKRSVDLVITQLEPAPEDMTEAHLRELTRSFHYERKLASPDDQLQIQTGDDLEPKVSDVLAAGKAFEPHELFAQPGVPHMCDICGQPSSAAIHSVTDDDAPEDDEAEEEPLLGMDGEQLSDEAPETEPASSNSQHTNPFEVVTT